MRFISARFHGVMDYLFGILLMASPWLFGFSEVVSARWAALVFGAMPIIMAMFTRYELGIWRLIPLRVHLGIDVFMGLALIISPWFFGFSSFVTVPFVVFGLIEVITPMITHRYADVPEEKRDDFRSTSATSESGTVSTGNYTPVYNRIQHH